MEESARHHRGFEEAGPSSQAPPTPLGRARFGNGAYASPADEWIPPVWSAEEALRSAAGFAEPPPGVADEKQVSGGQTNDSTSYFSFITNTSTLT